jgi:hypothetical protein
MSNTTTPSVTPASSRDMSRSQSGRFTRGFHAERPLSMCTSPTWALRSSILAIQSLDLARGRALPIVEQVLTVRLGALEHPAI